MMIYILAVSLMFLLILAGLILEYGILLPFPKGLPVLMYHKVSEGTTDGITIPAEKLKSR